MILPLHIEISDKLRICESRLVATINSSQTTLEVTSGEAATNFPSYFPFLILIESEIVLATARSTDTYTIEREARGTTAASHTSGTPLRAVVYSEDVGKISWYLVEKTAAYTATLYDCIILVDASMGDVTITLPAASTCKSFGYNIKKIDTTNHRVIIKPNDSETIDKEQSVEIGIPYTCLTVVCDGTEWWII